MTSANDPTLRTFVDMAAEHPFPLQNLPYGAIRGRNLPQRPCSRIGDFAVDLRAMSESGLLTDALGESPNLFQNATLNEFMNCGARTWNAVRERVSQLLRHDNPTIRDDAALRRKILIPLSEVETCMPVDIGDYTDFYSSKQHAFNVGTMFRGPENALMPNYLWIPVGYHGRASSVVLSGTPIRRPSGQTKADDADAPVFGPCRLLDFELEMGFFTGPGNPLGAPIPIDRAHEHIFGMVIVNDWSARDIQKWEYVPLGPFLAKNFATTISPWIVTMEALAPFRTAPAAQDPTPLDYLRKSNSKRAGETAAEPSAGWTYDIALEVALQPQNAPHATTVSRSNFKHLYWTMIQQLTHHASTGCNIRPGDLLASGTISGPTEDSYGSMLELAWRGTKPLKLSDGSERKFIQDHDTVIMSAECRGKGYRIGFGECTGKILPAL
ncbi:MAG: fumarylacetoacetase [Phycisphaerae bacterium]